MCCLMQKNCLENKMHFYSHTVITENQTNYATLSLLAMKAYSRQSQNTTLPL
jgi:hypothetical protein